ncbi:MAG: cytochrome c biogenesis protein CcdA [Halobacteriales archaeon]|nr:cytochrome c biogenesis protein CcdA [Halobacteriales archaeon]
MIDLEALRLSFAFSLGVATFFAPCAFPLLPGYVAFYLGRGDDAPSSTAARLRQAAVVGVLTSLGFFLVYAALAGIVSAVGARALRNISVLELVVGSLLILLGAAMAAGKVHLDRLSIPLPERRRSPASFVGFGVVYAAAAAGCTAPLFIGLAGVALAGGAAGAVATFAAYAAGMSALMILVTGLTAVGRDQVLRRISRNTGRINRVAGVVLAVAGVYQIYLFLFRFEGLAILGLA